MNTPLRDKLKNKKKKRIALIAVIIIFVIGSVIGTIIRSNNVEKEITVTLEIRCDTLVGHLEKLKNENLGQYVPKDGIIMKKTKITSTNKKTVYDLLISECRKRDIQTEASYSATNKSYYVESINYLYEFSGGKSSGWMYKVNGKFPNYGASSLYLENGANIVWTYTLDLGKDVM